MRKDAVDAGNKESKIESGIDQNRTKHDPAHKHNGEIPAIPGSPDPKDHEEPNHPIPAPPDFEG